MIASQLLAPVAVNVPAADADASGERNPAGAGSDTPPATPEAAAVSETEVAAGGETAVPGEGAEAGPAGDGMARVALAVDGARCRFHAGAGGWRVVRTLPNARGGVSVEQDRGPASATGEAAAAFSGSVLAAWNRQYDRDRAGLVTARNDWRTGRPGLRPNSAAGRERFLRRAEALSGWCREAAAAWRDFTADLVRMGLPAPEHTVPTWLAAELEDLRAGNLRPPQDWLTRCGIEPTA